MSLIRPRWLGLGSACALSATCLWWGLRSAPMDKLAQPPVASVDTDYLVPVPLDLAVSDGLFAGVASPVIDPAVQASTEAAAPIKSPPRLVGLAAHRRGAAVALAVDQSGQTHLLRTGEAIDGWTLTAAARDHAVFVQGDRRERVALDFANKAGDQASVPPPTQQLMDRPTRGEGATSP